MQRISIEQGLRALQRFLAAEWRLALPPALAFFGLPALLLDLLVQPLMRDVPATLEGMRSLSAALPWWVMPLMLLTGLAMAVGGLALMALALLPRISVGEAIAVAFRRLPGWIGLCVLAALAAMVGLMVAAALATALRGGQIVVLALTVLTMLAVSLALILAMPVLVADGRGPIATVRRGWAAYRGQVLRAAVGLLLFLVVAWIAAIAAQVALGSVALLLARMAGALDVGRMLVALLGALAVALQWGAFYLFAAMLFRQRSPRD